MTSACLFCKIVAREEPAEIVDEDGDILVIKNKFPKAPVHLLVMPRNHVSKTTAHKVDHDKLYGGLILKCGQMAEKMGLFTGNYKIIINGPAVSHFDHEHLHLLGGWAPGGEPVLE